MFHTKIYKKFFTGSYVIVYIAPLRIASQTIVIHVYLGTTKSIVIHVYLGTTKVCSACEASTYYSLHYYNMYILPGPVSMLKSYLCVYVWVGVPLALLPKYGFMLAWCPSMVTVGAVYPWLK